MTISTPLSVEQLGDRGAVKLAVGLHPRPPHGRALAAVEHPAMDRGAIGGARHQPVEHVELAHQMALADAADRRIARHLTYVFRAEREQANARAAASRGSRSLAAGMAGADHQNVVHDLALADRCFT